MTLSAQQREKQIKQAEELLAGGPHGLGFAKALYFGHFSADKIFPFPEIPSAQRAEVEAVVNEVRQYCEQHIDAAQIDRDADIPSDVIAGLGRLGVLGMTVPRSYGGRGLSQLAYTHVMEVIGGQDAGVAVFVNAHHSIGLRAILLAGSETQKNYWLPKLSSGEALAAFALTEPEAGSDAANVQTIATPTSDGKAYILNGQKRYITNAALAGMLTVMARTPIPEKGDTRVSAFLVTPDMPGFEVVEGRMPKCGIRGTATARLAFHEMRVPAENLLGKLGQGLKLALTVLDFGRTTFGASCTGAAKFCLRAAARHANTRRQFGQALGDFELVKKKLALMAADAFAMESATRVCAAMIDRGEEDFMIETAMVKLFASETLWRIVNDTMQIFGGQAYFSNEPYERMMRDARINLIGEGANDVLRAFIALAGMRNVGESLREVLDAVWKPWTHLNTLWQFGQKRLTNVLWNPEVPVKSPGLREHAHSLGRRIRDFGNAVESLLTRHREAVLERQYLQERLAEAGTELFHSACVLSRLDSMLQQNGGGQELELASGQFYLQAANRRIREQLAKLWDHDDEHTTATADVVLKCFPKV